MMIIFQKHLFCIDCKAISLLYKKKETGQVRCPVEILNLVIMISISFYLVFPLGW